MAPTLPTACGSLPPEGALRLQSGKAGPAALAGLRLPPYAASCRSLTFEWTFRLLPAKAGPAAL